MGLSVVILAAGKGTRMASDKPKVMHHLGGKPLLEHVVNTAQQLNARQINVIYGNGGRLMPEILSHLPVTWVKQERQLGTGDAVKHAIPYCEPDDHVLVLYGDVPLISSNTLRHLIDETADNGLGLLVAKFDDPTGFGRIVRDAQGQVSAIVEDKDATSAQRKIHEINTGIMTATCRHFSEWLPRLENKNQQGEYYLTDVVRMAVDEGHPVKAVEALSPREVCGVNDRLQLVELERYYQRLRARELAYMGASLMDPQRIDIRGHVTVGMDVIIDVNVILEGTVKLGSNVNIGPNVYLRNVIIGAGTEILANSYIDGATIGQNCQIGPFARIRPETTIQDQAKVGNFVELKKTILGHQTKVSHLSYLGDAVLGSGVNVGAGTITCNYDGVNKRTTTIEDHAFIGSNTALVAPVRVEQGAYVAAGSTLTDTAPAGTLTIARSRQQTIKNWVSPIEKKRQALEKDALQGQE